MEFPNRVDPGALFQALKNNNSTAGWDFIASYALERLNPILAHGWPENAQILARNFTIEDEPLDETIHFDVSIGSPSLQFNIENTVAHAVLRMPFTGRYTIKEASNEGKDEDNSVAIPDGTFIQCTVPQQCISGSVATDAKAVSEEIAVHQDGCFSFWISEKQAADSSGAIIIDFRNQHGTLWEIIQPQDRIEDNYEFTNLIIPKLQAWLHSSNAFVRYARARDIDPEGAVPEHPFCQPKAFLIAATGSESGGILSLLVNSQGSDNGRGLHPAKLNPKAVFPACPLPSGKTASLIMNHWAFRSKLLAPALYSAATSPDKKAPELVPAETGFKYNIWPVKDEPDVWWSMWMDGQMLPGYTGDMYKKQLKLDNKTYTFELTDKKASITYKAHDNHRAGVFETDISLNVAVDGFGIVSPNSKVEFQQLAFGGSDFDMWVPNPPLIHSLYNKDKPSKGGWRVTMRDYPPFSLQLPALDFAPIHRLFTPKVYENLVMDSAAGFQCPFDILMVGDVVQVTPPVRSGGDVRPEHYPGPETLIPVDKPSRYFDQFFAEEPLLVLFLQTMASSPVWKLKHVAASCKADFPAKSPQDVKSALAVGASFDHRLATGVYTFSEPEKLSDSMIFIDTLSDPPRVFLDEIQAATVEVRGKDHHVSFSLADPAASIKMIFRFPLFDPNEPIWFTGTISSGDDSRPISGFQLVTTAYSGLVHETVGFRSLAYMASMLGLLGVLTHVCAKGEEFFAKEHSFPRYSRLGRTLEAFDEASRKLLDKLKELKSPEK